MTKISLSVSGADEYAFNETAEMKKYYIWNGMRNQINWYYPLFGCAIARRRYDHFEQCHYI